MPLSRHQIRNECSLADPELYRAADKDDPEALLEGVAMAGLVGVLRQLGDLAEFAAEVFHDLHEEVMATSARGHNLKVRVQLLEAEFPSIEKAFLSQTNHSSFFYNAGTDWHPNMHVDQHLITPGDMPRFIMDSYEECRGPPSLFLLDKFDIMGAGACLKRYTDPSFFKSKASDPGITNADVQREKRTRKGKKKGPCWSNGETPEVLPTSRVKLHHLLLEERIENTVSDPARSVNLKRRLNGFPFDSKTGESYMEKFSKIASEHKVVVETSFCSSPLKLPAKSTYESGLGRHAISEESPDEELRHRRVSPTPDLEGTMQNLSMDSDEISESPKTNCGFEADNSLSTFHGEVFEKGITIDEGSKMEGNLDVFQSDDVASEVDNYADALTAMESEMDTDSELRLKSDLQVWDNKRQMSGFYASEAQQSHSSDSIGSSMSSDEGNSSFKKGISSLSFSDTPSISADNTPLEGEVSCEGFLSNEISEAKGTFRPPNQIHVNGDTELALPAGRVNADAGTGVAGFPVYRPDHWEQTKSNLTVSSPTLAHRDAESTLIDHVMEEGETKEMLCSRNATETEIINDSLTETNMKVSVLGDSNPSDENILSPRVFVEDQAMNSLNNKYSNVGNGLPWMSSPSDFSYNTREAFSLANSAKNQHVEDLNSEENLYSSSPAYQPLDEGGNNNPTMMEYPSEVSSEDLPINGLDSEGPIVFSGFSFNLLSTINAAEAKSKNSLGIIPLKEDAEDNHGEYRVGNQIHLPISVMSLVEERSSKQTLSELERHDTAMKSDFIESEPDDVIPLAAEVVVGLIPVMDSPDDFHSNNLHVSGLTDNILPLDPAANSTDDQIESPVPDTSHAGEQSLDLMWAELETRDKGAALDDGVRGVDDMISPSWDVAGDIEPITESPNSCYLKELKGPVIICDIPELNLAEEGTSCNGEEKFHDLPSSPNEKNKVVIHGKDFEEMDATDLPLSPDFNSNSDVHLTGADVKRDKSDSAPLAGLEEDDNQGSSLYLDPKKLDEESLSDFRESNKKRMEAEVSVPDSYSESGLVKEVGISQFASPDSVSDMNEPVHYDRTESEVLEYVPSSYSQAESSPDLDNAAETSSVFEQGGLDTNRLPSQKSNLTDHTEDASSLPIYRGAEGQKSGLSLDQLDDVETKVLQNEAEGNIQSSPHLEPKESLEHLDQEGFSSTASVSLFANFPNQPSVSKLLPQENCSNDDIGLPKDPFPISSVIGMFPGETVNVEEIPPLPPLPPFQWRMGNRQHASSALEKEAIESNGGGLPSLSPTIADQNPQSSNPFLPHYQSQNGPFLSQLPSIVRHETKFNSLPSLGQRQSVKQPLHLPGKFDELPLKDSHVGEMEKMHPTLSKFPKGTSIDTASVYASGEPHEETSQHKHQIAPETSLKDEKLDKDSARSEGNIFICDANALPTLIGNEQPHNAIPSLEGEITLPAQEDAKANEFRTTKLPRPRNLLIDDVVAIGKSKLRKVTERPRPPIQKVDERDSILEQIRAKSFNLKPTVVSRPNIQGPITNLQVAAILEKAKNIRQAFAGSDEDDEDSWSD